MDFSLLDKPVQFLKGVGPRWAEKLARLGLVTARDVLHHVPRRYDDASTVTPIGALEVGMDVTVVGRVRTKGVIPTRAGLRIFQAVLEDDSGRITVAWPGQPWLDRKLREGDALLATGPVKFFHGRQLQPREHTLLGRAGADDGSRAGGARPGGPAASDASGPSGRVDPSARADPSDPSGRAGTRDAQGPPDGPDAGMIFVAYPGSDEVPQWVLRGIFEKNLEALLKLSSQEEYLPDDVRESLGLRTLPEAFRALHRPASLADAEEGRRRLAFDELFFLQLVQARARYEQTLARPGIRHQRSNELIRPLHEALPFALTDAQARVLREIAADMTSAHRMSRLLQGDVGSGKTVVALFAMLLAAEGEWQAVLMAPTELLAEQHARGLRELVAPLGVEVALLTGSLGAADRRQALRALADGSARLGVGTHALIQEGVEFERLGLVVVDEQHRFGVRQRMALVARDPPPDVLVMSATPIPRSLALTLYGDLDLSVLDELPPGRRPVRTVLRGPERREQVYAFVEERLAEGGQAYVVYPLVEESEKVDLRSATREFERLRDEVFPDRRVGLLHGRLPPAEKDATMRAFLAGELDLLVATSVIEVGIDVPNATIMVVEHAERFGLSQLHQLRGRVGRGAAESLCVLVAEPGEVAAERLKVFRDTNDGFEIARADLRIRGQGDLFGAQQHGRELLLRHADLMRDERLLVHAQRLARAMVEADPELKDERHARARAVLEARWSERLEMFAVG